MPVSYYISDLNDRGFVRKEGERKGIYLHPSVRKSFAEGDFIQGWRRTLPGDTFIFEYRGVLVKPNYTLYPLIGTEDIGIHTGGAPDLKFVYQKAFSLEKRELESKFADTRQELYQLQLRIQNCSSLSQEEKNNLLGI